ncbi:hypothetical protein [Pseudarthrobacter sp. YAF2]|uniref:hypothetical protein n=1 Tax=Pseudarthrobacter sp. YAF2 TaxID=3233078 RepID=UPI003F94C76D
MALLTTRQKQQLIGPVLLFFLVAGFLGALWQGNPVAITVLVILVVAAALGMWIYVAKGLRAKARIRAAEESKRAKDRAAAEAAIARIRRFQSRD